MKIVGIIAEYNPFHNGHQYQIQYTKESLGADYVIAAMSSDYVQRGTPALLPKHVRAEMALLGGVDLVLELPVSVSTASAEFFAHGGVNLLSRLGVVDTLCFGSEHASIDLFQKTAQILIDEPSLYREILQKELKKGVSFPVARSEALLQYFRSYHSEFSSDFLETFFMSPNNILGIEYCKAILRHTTNMIPHPLKREGADYHELSLNSNIRPSASGIRHSLFSTQHEGIYSEEQLLQIKSTLNAMIPEYSMETFINGLRRNSCISESLLDITLHYRLLEETPETLILYPDINEELARRMINFRNQYQGFTQFTQLLKTKELTYTRIQRALLHIFLKLHTVTNEVPYARVLGFKKTAGPLLKEIKKNSQIPLITKLTSAEELLDPFGRTILAENTFASNIYESLIQSKTKQNFRHEYTKPVVII